MAAARYEAFRICHDYGYSTTEIGRFFERDHTTVLYALGALKTKRTKL